MPKPDYPRNKPGERLQFGGINVVLPPDALPPTKFPYAQNIRAYLQGRATSRATQDSSVLSLPSSVHSLRRLNDTTPAGPAQGFILVAGAGQNLYANTTQVAGGLSGNPLSFLPFRPAASVQPWMYTGDSATSGVTIDSSSGPPTGVPNGMLKVRSDGLCYAMGIAEPQVAPSVTYIPVVSASSISLLGPVTVMYWTDGSTDPYLQGRYIWHNASDPGNSLLIRSNKAPTGTVAGNSLLFDQTPGSPSVPCEWGYYSVNIGTVSTDGTDVVTWTSGSDFSDLTTGDQIVVNNQIYTITVWTDNEHVTVNTTIAEGTDLNYTAVTYAGVLPLFSTAPGTSGFVNFNCVILATLYVPVAGEYNIQAHFTNDMIWGIGASSTGTVTLEPGALGSLSDSGQTKTVWNGYKLLPRYSPSGNGGSADLKVAFSAAGNYPIEIDWCYGNSTGRTLTMTCGPVGGATTPQSTIQPLPETFISEAQYRYTYRSSATGATSNPSPESPEQPLAVVANTLLPTPSPDPQADKIDWYRLDQGLENYTYVGTSEDTIPAQQFSDTLLDADVSANPILDFDNYQPFPSIDLPRSGVVDVVNGVVNWTSGDQFNKRWLPGTIIIIGPTPNSIAYTLNTRPTSPTQLTASNVEIIGGIATTVLPPDGPNQLYEIAEPILAAQPLPYLWGPTDNINFFFGVGDPLRPGTLYWSKGNNPDAAPDTNQQDLTSPSEPLQNGCIVNGIGLVFSTERGFLILPNFFNALATVTGTTGSTWTIQESISTRGLYIPTCLATDGGATAFFRAKDGIYVSPSGQGAQSITDADLFNIFPHEGMVPQPVTIGGYTIWPPNDNKPEYQKLSFANGYLYYDYLDVNGFYRTLVFDAAAKGWVIDVYQYPVRVHILEEGVVNGTLTGNSDGSVRALTNTGAELGCAIILTRCEIAGDVRAQKHFGDLYIEADTGGR